MRFADPQFFYLLLLIPIYFFLLFIFRKKKNGIKISVFSDLKKAQGKVSFFRRNIKYFRHILVIILIILWSITLARPQGGHEKEDITKNGIDMIVAVDVSGSMLAEDLKPNRIEAAKNALERFVNNLHDDRLGIIVFAGQAFTQSPLTFDYNVLQEYIKNISTDSINKNINGLSGTAIGDAILSAVNRFKKSKNRTKVLVLITDGDANVGVDPEIAAKKASENNIKIYTVGIGRVGGAPIPVTDMFGRKTVARNADGSIYKATFNEDALKKIANISGGKYFRASDNESFKKVLAEINSLEKRKISVNKSIEYTENFYPYLTGLFITMLLYLFILAFVSEIE